MPNNIAKDGQNILLHISKNDFLVAGTYSWQIKFENDVDCFKSNIGNMKVLDAIV